MELRNFLLALATLSSFAAAVPARAENRSIIFTSNCAWAPGQWTESSTQLAEALQKRGWKVHNLFESEAARSCTRLFDDPFCKSNRSDPSCCPAAYKAIDTSIPQMAARLGIAPEKLKPATKANLIGELRAAATQLHAGDQVLLMLETHGSEGRHSICTGDRVGGSMSIEDVDFNNALAAVRASGARLAVIDDSCYGGLSVPILRKHGCVMASVDGHHVSVSVQNTSQASFLGNAIGSNLVELLKTLPESTVHSFDTEAKRAVGLDELYLKALSNGFLANEVAQISAASSASTDAAQVFSDWLREKAYTNDKGPVWPVNGVMPEIILGPAYKTSTIPFRVGATLPDLYSYKTSFAEIQALASSNFILLRDSSNPQLEATYATFWKPMNSKRLDIAQMRETILALKPMNATPLDAYRNVEQTEQYVRQGLREFEAAFNDEQRLFQQARTIDYSASYSVPGMSDATLASALSSLEQEGKIVLSKSRIAIGYGWDVPNDESFLRREAARIGDLVSRKLPGASANAIASAIIDGEKSAKSALDPARAARIKAAYYAFYGANNKYRTVYNTLRAIVTIPIAQARFYDYVIRRDAIQRGQGTAAERRAQDDCSSFKLIDL